MGSFLKLLPPYISGVLLYLHIFCPVGSFFQLPNLGRRSNYDSSDNEDSDEENDDQSDPTAGPELSWQRAPASARHHHRLQSGTFAPPFLFAFSPSYLILVRDIGTRSASVKAFAGLLRMGTSPGPRAAGRAAKQEPPPAPLSSSHTHARAHWPAEPYARIAPSSSSSFGAAERGRLHSDFDQSRPWYRIVARPSACRASGGACRRRSGGLPAPLGDGAPSQEPRAR